MHSGHINVYKDNEFSASSHEESTGIHKKRPAAAARLPRS